MATGPFVDLAVIAQAVAAQQGLKLGRMLGSGAQKSTFHVFDASGASALKIAQASVDPIRLAREGTALMSCNHPGIAALRFAAPVDVDGVAYWVVREELLAGGTLEERLAATGPMNPTQGLALARGLTSVLQHLDERRFVHRDIKPANIMFRSPDSEEPVLTDFGVVRILDAPTITHQYLGMGPGTPQYASAEQLNNEQLLIDWRTDQFGLALVVAEGCLGRHAFCTPSEDVRVGIERVRTRQPIPDESRVELEARGLGVLVTALADYPVKRHRTPADLMSALVA